MEEVSLGLVGYGYWGPNLARNFLELAGARLSYICDSDPERLSTAARQCPGTALVSDPVDIFDDDSVDALVITAPAVHHYELARHAMLSGKHVFIEKPLSLRLEDGEDLVRMSEEKGRVLMVGHLLIYHPVVEAIKGYVERGEIGEILYMYSQRLNLGRVRHDENCLWSLGPHDISVMLHVLERDPLEVSVQGMDYLRDGVEDIIFCTLKFPGDVIANLHISWLDPHKERKITIVGKKKMLVFDDMASAEKLRIYDKGVEKGPGYVSFADVLSIRVGDVVSPVIAMEEPLRRECQHFIDCVREGSRPLTDGQEGLRVLKILAAGQESLEKGGVPVSLGGSQCVRS